MILNIKLLGTPDSLPMRGTPFSAGFDLKAASITEPFTIKPFETVMVGTGIAVEIPDGHFGAVFPRSGIAAKCGLRLANCVGVIDSDYRGELKVALHNDTTEPQTIEPMERIAQLIIIPYISPELNVVGKLSNTERGSGGYGSTGRHEREQEDFHQLTFDELMSESH